VQLPPRRAEARRELLELLKPARTPEEILKQFRNGWQAVLEPDYSGGEITVEALSQHLRLSESLFFSEKLADGHGVQEGRMPRNELLLPFATHMMELLSVEHLAGDQKVLARYLLLATMGPSAKLQCAHVRSPWATEDNRHSYRASLSAVADRMLGRFAKECGRMREIIRFKASHEPKGACAKLCRLQRDEVVIPEKWREEGRPDCLFWREVHERQRLRYDPPWALEVGDSPTRLCLALLRLEAAKDLEEIAELNQVYHCSMSEMFARGCVQYSKLCNEAFQRKLAGIASRAARREKVDVSPPDHIVPHKKLKRLMEKVREAREELGMDMTWPGRSAEYIYHSHAFHILDLVRMSFTCKGQTTEEQVRGCMALVDELCGCTVEDDGVCVVRMKSGFSPGVEAVGGYADVKLLVYAELGSHRAFDGSEMPLRIVGEVQLILDGYMKVKNKMHLVYEVHRGSFDR